MKLPTWKYEICFTLEILKYVTNSLTPTLQEVESNSSLVECGPDLVISF